MGIPVRLSSNHSRVSLSPTAGGSVSNGSSRTGLLGVKTRTEGDGALLAPNPVNRGAFKFPSVSEVKAAQRIPGDAPLLIDDALIQGIKFGASDVFIKPNSPVWYRVNGKAFPVGTFDWLDNESMYSTAMGMILSTLERQFTQDLELDTSYVIQDGEYEGSRFRVNFIRSDDNGISLVFRYINPRIETPDALGLPQEVIDWSDRPRGLVLVTGPTGSGKSTSLSSLIRRIQLNESKHILTIEKPVETVYPKDGLSLVTQREVGQDTLSFANALTSAMRDSPDVILVGEMRTNEEISATIEAADTGHLTFSTLHTKSAEETILRIMSKFEGEDKRDVLARLSSNLVGIMAQQLLQRKDGKGRIAVHELLTVDRDVSEMILQGDVHGIHDYMMEHKSSMDHQLLRMVVNNDITYSEAYGHAMNPNDFKELAHGPRLVNVINFDE